MPNGMSEGRIREIVVEEVSKQIRPIHDWMLGFWANGSGRPPGYFQMRVKSDDERYARLESETRNQSDTLDILKDFMQEQRLSREAREKAERDRRIRHARYWSVAKWALGIVGPALLGLCTLAYQHLAPVLQILWEDYLKAHPAVTTRLKDLSSENSEPAYAGRQRSQDSGLPSSYVPQ